MRRARWTKHGEREGGGSIYARTQVAALDHTIQQTNIWLKTLAEELHIEDRHVSYGALRSVLHVLRDRLTPDQAVHLGAQLPVLVRGIYYDGWRVAGKPSNERQPAEFVTLVAADLPRRWPATRYG